VKAITIMVMAIVAMAIRENKKLRELSFGLLLNVH